MQSARQITPCRLVEHAFYPSKWAMAALCFVEPVTRDLFLLSEAVDGQWIYQLD